MSRKSVSNRMAAELVASGKVSLGDPVSSREVAEKHRSFLTRQDEITTTLAAGGPTIGDSPGECPRCHAKTSQVKLSKDGENLPYCAKCRVVIPKP